MNIGFSELFNQQAFGQGRSPADGAVIGIVTGIADTETLYRVKISFPTISDTYEDWARVVVPMAGPDCGMRFPLALKDEVLVIFGHLREPYVIGALWNGQDKPPADDAKLHVIKSRSGHVIKLNDTDGKETVEIIDATGKNSIVFDTAKNSITISSDKDITLAAPNGKISLTAKTIGIAASDSSDVSAGKDGMKVHTAGDVFVSGKTVNLN